FIPPACCACATNGQAAAEPAIALMKSRRLMLAPRTSNGTRKLCCPGRGRECPLWVMCGRRLGKNFLTSVQHWSGAVMCPACLCGGEAAGHNALRGSGPNQNHAL